MNRIISLLLTLLAGVASVAQINYEPGYYIDNNGQKTSGLIRNVAWKDNPGSIDFRAAAESTVVNIPLKALSAFSVADAYSYRRFDIKYDESPIEVGDLSHTPNPQWVAETALLKVLSEGTLILYEYSDHNLTRFFISDSREKTPEQLVFKQYIPSGTSIGENNLFRQQLFTAMKDKGLPESDFIKLRYNRDDMVRIFAKYNGEKQTDFITKQNKGKFNVKVVAGISSGKMDFEHVFYDQEGDFGNQIVPMFGVEGEFVLPFNQQKWAIFMGANYQSYQADPYTKGTFTFESQYRFIQFPIGLRHFFYLGKDSRLFLNVGYNFALDLDSEVKYKHVTQFTSSEGQAYINQSSSFTAGAGFGYKRFAVELRIETKHDILDKEYWNAEYSSSGIILSYKLF